MLDDFVPEVPVVQLPHQPVELDGFDSEVRRKTLRPVTARAQWKWPRMSTGSVVLTAVCVCAGLTLGTIASSIGHAPTMAGDKSKPQFAVSAGETLVALSPEQFSADSLPGPSPDVIGPVRDATAAEPGRTESDIRERPTTVARLKTTVPSAQPSVTPAIAVDAPQPASQEARVQLMPISADPIIPEPLRLEAPSAAANTVAPAATVAPPVTLPRTVALGVSLAPRVETAGRSVMEEAAVRALLEGYRDAYEQLDVRAARRVWPGVDDRRLARAFSDLESQTLDFDDCDFDLKDDRGVARCRGRATYVARVGKRTPQTQTRNWTFQVHREGNRWAIDSVRSE
jgi:hypothetical protein